MWCFSPHVWCSTTWRCRSCNGMLLCPSWVSPSNSSEDFLFISEKEGTNRTPWKPNMIQKSWSGKGIPSNMCYYLLVWGINVNFKGANPMISQDHERRIPEGYTLQRTNISPQNGILKMMFLFPRWDLLIPWRVIVWWTCHWHKHPELQPQVRVVFGTWRQIDWSKELCCGHQLEFLEAFL